MHYDNIPTNTIIKSIQVLLFEWYNNKTTQSLSGATELREEIALDREDTILDAVVVILLSPMVENPK